MVIKKKLTDMKNIAKLHVHKNAAIESCIDVPV